mmetsp:Transcript_12985/g.31634  ORF Transcript_12985/g.31634 Transcript_12985/m.31634 type:complete len:261 (-) Transcript_12985:756-1538(-)
MVELLVSSVVVTSPPEWVTLSNSMSRTSILLAVKEDSFIGSLIDKEPPGLLLGAIELPGLLLLLAMTNRRLSPTAVFLSRSDGPLSRPKRNRTGYGGSSSCPDRSLTGYEQTPGGVTLLSIDCMLESHAVDAVLMLLFNFFFSISTARPTSSASWSVVKDRCFILRNSSTQQSGQAFISAFHPLPKSFFLYNLTSGWWMHRPLESGQLLSPTSIRLVEDAMTLHSDEVGCELAAPLRFKLATSSCGSGAQASGRFSPVEA